VEHKIWQVPIYRRISPILPALVEHVIDFFNIVYRSTA